MLRERAVGESLWEAVLPNELRELPAEFGKVDEILDDDRFLAPFRSRLTSRIGRPTIPIETYLRLMYLKHRYGLGYETLCKEVSDSFTWRRFCRIAIDGRVPDPTTLMKLAKRLGPELLEELNAGLLSLAVERKVLRSRRLRVDTTVVQSDTRRPTDSGLCAQAVSRLTRLDKRIQAAGLAPRMPLRDRRCSVGKRVRQISATLARGGRTRTTVDRLTAEIAERARKTLREGRALVRNARRTLAGKARAGAVLVSTLAAELEAAEQVLAQTDLRLSGQRTIPTGGSRSSTRMPARSAAASRSTRPSSATRLASPTPPRASSSSTSPSAATPPTTACSSLEQAVAKAKTAGMQVRSVHADRAFGTSVGDQALARQRVRDPVIPRQQRADPREQTRSWRRRYRYRNGLESRISQLKRKGLARTRLRGLAGAQTWVAGYRPRPQLAAHGAPRMRSGTGGAAEINE